MRALVIDDSSLMRKMVERALRLTGLGFAEVLHAGNGEEGLATLRELAADAGEAKPLHLIVSDINMPVMDGLAFLEQRQKEHLAKDVPVVMITTEGCESSVQRALAAGAKGYLCKPFVQDDVRATVLALVGR